MNLKFKTLEDWHGHEGLSDTFNEMLSQLTYVCNVSTVLPEDRRINLFRVALETAFQLGRQSMREENENS